MQLQRLWLLVREVSTWTLALQKQLIDLTRKVYTVRKLCKSAMLIDQCRSEEIGEWQCRDKTHAYNLLINQTKTLHLYIHTNRLQPIKTYPPP